jgi:hypothetical protein
MVKRLAVSSFAVAALMAVALEASAPAQAGHWGGPGYGFQGYGPPPGYWAWKRRHFRHHGQHNWGRPVPPPYAGGGHYARPHF